MKIGCSIIADSFISKEKRNLDNNEIQEKVFNLLSGIKDIGFEFGELTVGLLKPMMNYQDVYSIISKIEKSDLKITHYNSFIPMKYRIVGKKQNNDELNTYVKESFNRVSLSGGKSIGFGSARARLAPYGYPKHEVELDIIRFLNLCLKYSEINNVQINLEPLNKRETNTINSCQEALQIVEKINHPSLGVLFDTYHILMDNDDYRSINSQQIKYLKHVHVSSLNRKSPLEEKEFHCDFIKWLKDLGYNGSISIECLFDDYYTEAKKAYEFLSKLVNK